MKLHPAERARHERTQAELRGCARGIWGCGAAAAALGAVCAWETWWAWSGEEWLWGVLGCVLALWNVHTVWTGLQDLRHIRRVLRIGDYILSEGDEP